MISARKLAANRANARFSTGPHSTAGKARAARNARRHGLNVAIGSDPILLAEVEALTREIAGIEAGSEFHELARRIAHAQVEVKRVRRTRRELLAQALAHCRHQRPAEQEHDPAMLDRPSPTNRASLASALFSEGTPGNGPDEYDCLLAELVPRLTALDRYERRALSRRKFAIRAFDLARASTKTSASEI